MEHIFLVSDATPRGGTITFINGTTNPDTLELVAGRTYRFRFIGIGANAARTVSLAGAAGAYTWRPVARDGWEHQAKTAHSEATVRLAPGTTFDFEVTPAAAGELTLTADVPLPPGRIPSPVWYPAPTVVPIRVRRP